MKLLKRILKICGVGVVLTTIAGGAVAAWIYFSLVPQLPATESLQTVKYQVPLRVYSADARLIAEFGEKKRLPVAFGDVPESLVQAFLSAEDDRFFDHPGVDYQGILRAAIELIRTGERRQGGSTITMQVARNFFLTPERTYIRKLNEILLALKIERELTKEQIFALYLNKIYLGHRAYGVAAAAQVYYNKSLHELSLAEIAMIAGLPKAPSKFNPIVNPQRATTRRNYVLGRMLELGFIDQARFDEARAAAVTAKVYSVSSELEAPYLAEMVRNEMVAEYGNDAYTQGFQVYTTVTAPLQQAAVAAVRKAILDYDQRHGYRGPERQVSLSGDETEEALQQLLGDRGRVGPLYAAVVVAVAEQSADVYVDGLGQVTIEWPGLEWAREYISVRRLGSKLKTAADVLAVGDVIRVRQTGEQSWQLAQVPEVEGALVSVDPKNGAVQALVGGFNYFKSKYNRVIQARRQPGSSFKPFIYSAALENGFTPASLINDAPVVFDDSGLESAWRPENYSGKFFGPTRLREALIKSRNLVSIRLLQDIGIVDAINYVERFGFAKERLPRNLSLSLGNANLTLMDIATGYAVFANGGFKVSSHFIQRIESDEGEVLFQARPHTVCLECLSLADDTELAESLLLQDLQTRSLNGSTEAHAEDEQVEAPLPVAERVVSEQNVYLMTSIMRDVITRGTGRRALALKRSDLAGKTGTTNDQHDAWFSGYNGEVAATAWVGFDQAQTLGDKETGGRAALPMWIEYMRYALKGVPQTKLSRPAGMVTVKIDPESGLLARSGDRKAIFETFTQDTVPERYAETVPVVEQVNGDESGVNAVEMIF